MFQISTTPIETAAVVAQVEDSTCGGLVIFEGRVRNHHRGRDVLRLEYEAYQALAEADGNRIVRETIERFHIHAAACVHRTGMLEINDIAVVVAVSAAHRDAAFDACRHIIDELKATVPIWKHEYYADGTDEWTGCDHCAGHHH
ncbi:molybdenum cofactor biosynthesis protein MoaE [Luteolibacter sp. LG18]|uniref:molybdenum cofactor biosynthesis protein MoaE n=1 Tax=Luteolibacter sp. LG18 TaxID=2819286 RepID=UPI002B2A5C10|nr:molybdopterin-converting factor chain 2 [Luteolibacter sp. LG18]